MTHLHEGLALDEWMIVAGGFHGRGGQDKANAALVRYLATHGRALTIIGHDIDSDFQGWPNIRCIKTPRLLNSSIASDFVLAPYALLQSRRRRGGRVHVVVNGGNVVTDDVNWAHCVHRAWHDCVDASVQTTTLRDRTIRALWRHREGKAFRTARVIVANSERTKQDILRCYSIDERRVHVAWLGSDPDCAAVLPLERTAARKKFDVSNTSLVAAFVGVLGNDDNKGFGTLLEAWTRFTRSYDARAVLLVAGHGNAYAEWSNCVMRAGCEHSIRLLGFRTDVADVLAASDLLISPVRYEAYGLNVHEALARGVPAMVTRTAGIASRYPLSLDDLLIDDPTNSSELVEKLRAWSSSADRWRALTSDLGARLREWTWDDMAARIVEIVEHRKSAGLPTSFDR